MVETGSVKRDGVEVRFVVTDTAKSIPVVYRGALPDLFREGKGVVAQGQLGADGVFRAREVLAKHDENYMPPEATDAVEKAHRRGEDGEAMIPELGQVALCLALAVALVQAIVPLAGAIRRPPALARPPRRARRCSSPSPSAASPTPSSPTISRCSTWRSTPTARCRCSTASPASGAGTRARSCCGA